jgi:hypothetical protein
MSSQIVLHDIPGMESIAVKKEFNIDNPDNKAKTDSKKQLEKQFRLWLLPGIARNVSI